MFNSISAPIKRRKMVEEALQRSKDQFRKSEESFKNLFANNPLPMWVFDRETMKFLEVNEAAVDLYGYDKSEFLGMTIFDIRPERDRERLKEVLYTERPDFRRSGLWQHRKKSGDIIQVEITSHTLLFENRKAVLVVAQDVTETKRLEAEKAKLETKLSQIHKMEALGHLAGGVAHDFNNLLMAINGYCELAKLKLSHHLISDSKIDEIHKVALMGASLTKQLLAFSRKQALELVTLNLNEIVESMEPMLRRLIRQNIELRLSLEEHPWAAKADRSQIEQAILNLVVNARDAMPNGGILSLETTNIELDATYAHQYPDILPGEYIRLSVTDTGHGMDQEMQLRIFEPFFTTKEGAQGTGLGLATVFGVVKQSSGHIAVYSEPQKGTAFRIYLPRVVETPKREIAADQYTAVTISKRLSVLLVDDNDLARQALASLLELNNCVVVQTGDAEKALEILKEENPIDILVTDIVMPKISGQGLATEARILHPNLSVLYMSGYSEDVIQYRASRKTGFLTKPVSIQKILSKITELVN